jgi:hypothetical protein
MKISEITPPLERKFHMELNIVELERIEDALSDQICLCQETYIEDWQEGEYEYLRNMDIIDKIRKCLHKI